MGRSGDRGSAAAEGRQGAPPRGIGVAALVVWFIAAGCGPQPAGFGPPDGPGAQGLAKPEMQGKPPPGEMICWAPLPVRAAQPKWAHIWAWPIDKTTVTGGHVEPWGYVPRESGFGAWELQAQSVDSFVAFVFDSRALEAEGCSRLRLAAPQTRHAGLWWARETDLEPERYPFALERFQPFEPIEPGVFEVDLADIPNWNGRIRLLRLDLFTPPGEILTLAALDVELSKGTFWTSAQPTTVVLRREGPQVGQERFVRFRTTRSLSDLEALAGFWYRSSTDPPEPDRSEWMALGTSLGVELLDAGDVPGALRAFSAVCRGSGEPIEYLYELRDDLSEEAGKRLWPDDVYLVIEGFEGGPEPAFEKWVDEQDRPLVRNGFDNEVFLTRAPSAVLEVGEPRNVGRCWYALPASIRLSEKTFGIRLVAKRATLSEVGVAVQCWFPAVRKSSLLTESESTGLADGWRQVSVREGFLEYPRKKDYDPMGGRIIRIGLSVEGPADTYWVDRIELYLTD